MDHRSQKSVVPILSSLLSSITQLNDRVQIAQAPAQSQNLSFHADTAPAITVENYLKRIVRYAPCSSDCFVMALIYIDRLVEKNKNLMISSLNVHRILITSIMLASKFYEDTFMTNAFYARVGGLSVKELNQLELDFIFLVHFSLDIVPTEFERYRHQLLGSAMSQCSMKQVPSSSWCAMDPYQLAAVSMRSHGSYEDDERDLNDESRYPSQYRSVVKASAPVVSIPIPVKDCNKQRLSRSYSSLERRTIDKAFADLRCSEFHSTTREGGLRKWRTACQQNDGYMDRHSVHGGTEWVW